MTDGREVHGCRDHMGERGGWRETVTARLCVSLREREGVSGGTQAEPCGTQRAFNVGGRRVAAAGLPRTCGQDPFEPSFALTSESMNWPGRGPGGGHRCLWGSGWQWLSQPLAVPHSKDKTAWSGKVVPGRKRRPGPGSRLLLYLCSNYL